MRTIVFIDDAVRRDQGYFQHLTGELPKRLKLLSKEYSATEWTCEFAHDVYGVRTLEEFATSIERHGPDYEAILVVPDPEAIEANIDGSNLRQSKYLSSFVQLTAAAKVHDMPVIGYVDEPGPRSDFNLTMAGASSVVDHIATPALLALKIAKAVNKDADANGLLKMGDLCVDTKTGNASYGDKTVSLTPSEKAMLLTLFRHKGMVRTKERLMTDLYRMGEEPEIKIVDVFTAKLRAKLNEVAPGLGYDMIRTSWGSGYIIPSKMPENRRYYGMLRLDPAEEGSYQVADSNLVMSAEEFEVFQTLYERRGMPLKLSGNYISSRREVVGRLENLLSAHLICFGSALQIDEEEGTVSYNMSYSDVSMFDASNFYGLMKQNVIKAGPYNFIRQSTSQYILQGTETLFSLPEVRLMEHLGAVQNQAVRARSLYNAVRDSAHNLRGSESVEENIVDLARSVFRKLEESGVQQPDSSIYIYHDEFLSFGPAEEIPDPAKLEEERKARLKQKIQDHMQTASNGKKVELERLDCGYFTLLVHPVLKEGLIEDTNVLLNSAQTKIIEELIKRRPAIVSPKELFETVYPNRPLGVPFITNQLTILRKTLKEVHPGAEKLVFSMRGEGYLSLFPDEEPPVRVAPANPDAEARAPRPRAVRQEAELVEISLREFTLLQDPDSGTARIGGTNISLRKGQVSALMLLAAQHPRTVYDGELTRVTGIKGVRTMIDRMRDEWATHGVPFPLEIKSMGYAWRDVAFNAEPQSNGEIFKFSPPDGITQRCEITGAEFTVREVELLEILQNRKGQTIDSDVIREDAVRFKWPDNVIQQTMEQVHRKLNGTGAAERVRVEKKRGALLLTLQ